MGCKGRAPFSAASGGFGRSSGFHQGAGLKSSDWVPHILQVGFAFFAPFGASRLLEPNSRCGPSFSEIPLLPSITPILLPTCRPSLLGLWPCASWPWGCCPCLPWKSFMIQVAVLYSSFSAGIDVDRLFFCDQPLSSEQVCSAFSVLHSACRPCGSVHPRG